MIDITAPFKERAEWVLSRTFQGLHHIKVHKIKWDYSAPFQYAEYSTNEELSTFDTGRLTLLVIAAHDACVRVSVAPSGPRMVKIQMWPRDGREGSKSHRHPTIEQAIKTMRDAE